VDFEKMKFNMDQEKRDEIVGVSCTNPKIMDICLYDGLDVQALKSLIELKFADPEERQNDSPTVREFCDFMEKHPEFKANGYTVDKSRPDYRVSVTGLEGDAQSTESIEDFVRMFRNADEFEQNMNHLYCWYD
jgi:hypothetical protein